MEEDGPPGKLPDLPRFGGGVGVGRAAQLRGGAGGPAKNKPMITTMAPWAMTAAPQRTQPQQRRSAAPWAPPAPGKAGTSPEKRTAVAPPPPPPQAFLDSCPGLSGRGGMHLSSS
jgi:hypothetical protein